MIGPTIGRTDYYLVGLRS